MVRIRSITGAVNNEDSCSALRLRSITSMSNRMARSALARASAGTTCTIGRWGASARRRGRVLRTDAGWRSGGLCGLSPRPQVCTAPAESGGSNWVGRDRKQWCSARSRESAGDGIGLSSPVSGGSLDSMTLTPTLTVAIEFRFPRSATRRCPPGTGTHVANPRTLSSSTPRNRRYRSGRTTCEDGDRDTRWRPD